MINVVAAVIKDEQNKILITQRNLKKSQGGLWEFPGGKIEPNETREQAIVREIKEELDMDITVNKYLAEKTFVYPEKQKIFDTFADESAAAEQTLEIEEAALGNIIKDEAKRIKEKQGK